MKSITINGTKIKIWARSLDTYAMIKLTPIAGLKG